MADENEQVPVVDGLPINYPFDLDHPPTRYVNEGALHNHHAAVFSEARSYRWAGLDGDDFAVHPSDEEWHLFHLLNELRPKMREALAALDELGKVDVTAGTDDAVCWRVADLTSVLGHFMVPAQLAEEAITKAVRAARRRTNPRQAEHDDQWAEFDDQAAELSRDASGQHQPMERRLAAMDQLIAQAHLQRARLVREQAALRGRSGSTGEQMDAG